MKTIGQYRKLDFLDDYYVLDVVSFIEGKTFRIENVRHDKVNGQPCVKIDTRIVSDNNTKKDFDGSALKKNEGKVVTFQVVEDNPEILELTKTQLLDTVGHKLIISGDNIKGYYTYRGSCLIIHINDFKEIGEVIGEPKNVENTDRFLMSLNKFKTFHFKALLQSEQIKLSGISSKGKQDLRINAHIRDKGFFEIKIPVNDVKDLPCDLLTLDKLFNECVEYYDFDYAVTLNSNTVLLVVLKSITFKAGVLDDEPYAIQFIDTTKNHHNATQDTPPVEQPQQSQQRPYPNHERQSKNVFDKYKE